MTRTGSGSSPAPSAWLCSHPAVSAVSLLCLVALVSLLVQVYSLGYLHDEPKPALGRYVEFCDELPTNATGKVLRSVLRTRAAHDHSTPDRSDLDRTETP